MKPLRSALSKNLNDEALSILEEALREYIKIPNYVAPVNNLIADTINRNIRDSKFETAKSLLSQLEDSTYKPSVSLRTIREASQRTTSDLAKELEVRESDIENLESQFDDKLPLLHMYIEMLGGTAEVTVKFPGNQVYNLTRHESKKRIDNNSNLDQSEHNRFIYLLDAIEVSPEKFHELISVSEKNKNSDQFKAYLLALKSAMTAGGKENLLQHISKMRDRLK